MVTETNTVTKMNSYTLQLPEPCPARVGRAYGAELLTLAGFQTTAKSISNWALPTVMINGRATYDTHELFAEAQRRVDVGSARTLNRNK